MFSSTALLVIIFCCFSFKIFGLLGRKIVDFTVLWLVIVAEISISLY